MSPKIRSTEIFKAIETAIPATSIEQAMPAAGYAYGKIKVEEERTRSLPAQLVVCLIIAMSLWSRDSMRDVLKNLIDGLSEAWVKVGTGLALFGVVGGAVGAVTGEDRNANACLDCGTSWKAEDLYKILQLIKKSTDINPDMTTTTDRSFVNDFILEMTPYIETMSKAQKEAETIVTVSENKKSLFAAAGCGSGCIITLIL